MLNLQDIEQVRVLFNPKPEIGKTLPDPRSVQEHTEFLLRGEDNYFTLHKMIEGKWHIAKVDINSQVYYKPI